MDVQELIQSQFVKKVCHKQTFLITKNSRIVHSLYLFDKNEVLIADHKKCIPTHLCNQFKEIIKR